MIRLHEYELEFLYEKAWGRSGSQVILSRHTFRVQLDTPQWPIALGLSARGILSKPMLCGSANSRRFAWLELGIEVMQQYWQKLQADANRPKPKPTVAPPGSKEKIEELRRRATLGEELWSERDWAPSCREAERVWKSFI